MPAFPYRHAVISLDSKLGEHKPGARFKAFGGGCWVVELFCLIGAPSC